MKIKINTKISLLILSTLLMVACGNKDSKKVEGSEKSLMKEEHDIWNIGKKIAKTKLDCIGIIYIDQ